MAPADPIPWWKGATVYQIYPRSFCDTTGNGQGDLPGILSKLDHIADLGVDAIWLSPIYPSPNQDWGYDVSDYCDVHPDFGTLADFDTLLDAIHRRGLKLILDQVLSHTSDRHPWFVDSLNRGDTSDWYIWADPKPDGTAPNNWLSDFGGPAWHYHALRGQCYHHKFLRTQPALNFHTAAVRDAALNVLRFWLDRGVDGFRLDVANSFFHDATLADNEPVPMQDRTLWHRAMDAHQQRHLHDSNRPEIRGFHHDIRRLMDGYPDTFVFAENHEEPDHLQGFYNHTDALHSFYTPEISQHLTRPQRLAAIQDNYSAMEKSWPCVTMSNHDYLRPASATRLPKEFPADTAHRAKFFLTLLFALRGTVLMYQGEELGLPQTELTQIDQVRDPVGLLNWPLYKGRDGSRTPIPWSSTGAAMGFSTADITWLPMPETHRALAAEQQQNDQKSPYAWAQRLIALRKKHPALALGDMTTVEATNDAWIFERSYDGETLRAIFVLQGDHILPATADVLVSLSDFDGRRPLVSGDAIIIRA